MTAKQLLEALADLEARIAKIYERFATEFRDVSSIGDLWLSMGHEESHHAERLSLAAGSAPHSPGAAAMAEHLSALAALVAQCEREVAHPMELQEALRVTADLEEAEAEHLHGALRGLGDWARQLADDPGMQHRQRSLLEYAIKLFGTPALQERLAWQRFHE